MLEATLVLATIARRWRLELMDGQDLHSRPAIALRPPAGVSVMIATRDAGLEGRS
jgi:hypothetical protein